MEIIASPALDGIRIIPIIYLYHSANDIVIEKGADFPRGPTSDICRIVNL